MIDTKSGADVRVPLVIGAIGHRDLVAAETGTLEARVHDFLDTLQRKYPDLRVSVLTSLADGADRLVAGVAKSLHMPITYVLPMPTELYERDFDGASLGEYRDLLRSGNVLTLPLVGDNTAEQVTRPGARRDLQYAGLGAFIAAHCHILLALWDGNENGASGGTAQIIRYHQDDYMPGLTNGEPRPRLDVSDDESDLVHHVVCSRDRPDGTPNPPLHAGEAWWLSRDFETPRTRDMPSRYEVVLRRMVEFSQDVTRHNGLIEQQSNVLLAHDIDVVIDQGTRAIAELFKAADSLAKHYHDRTHAALRVLYVCAGLAGLCYIAYGNLSDWSLMIYPYWVFMAASIAAYLAASRGAWQRRSMDYRVLAEALRVQFYWAIAGVERSSVSRFGHDAFLKRQELELGWIRNMLRVAGQRDDATDEVPSELGVEIAVRDWVGSQLNYFRRRWPQLLVGHRITGLLDRTSFAAGLLLAGWLALAQLFFERQPTNGLIALMGFLPVVAWLLQHFAQRTSGGELISQYQFMERVLSNAQRQLLVASSASERRRILRELGNALLRENSQWVLRLRERPISTVG
jgi:hypothetical protein